MEAGQPMLWGAGVSILLRAIPFAWHCSTSVPNSLGPAEGYRAGGGRG
jgi:hypothetical protein